MDYIQNERSRIYQIMCFQNGGHDIFILSKQKYEISIVLKHAGSNLAQFVGHEVSQQKCVGGMSHNISILPHDLYLIDLIGVLRFQHHSCATGQIPHNHLEKTNSSGGFMTASNRVAKTRAM